MKKMFIGLLIVSLMVSLAFAAVRRTAAPSAAAGRVPASTYAAMTASSVQIPYANVSAIARSKGDARAEALSNGNVTVSANNSTGVNLTTATAPTATAGYKTGLISVPAGKVLILTADLTINETAASTFNTSGNLEIDRVETLSNGVERELAAQLTEGKWRKNISWLANEAPSGTMTIVTKPLPYAGKYRANVTFGTTVFLKNSSSRLSGVIRSVSLRIQ